jgi:hypothetical protein
MLTYDGNIFPSEHVPLPVRDHLDETKRLPSSGISNKCDRGKTSAGRTGLVFDGKMFPSYGGGVLRQPGAVESGGKRLGQPSRVRYVDRVQIARGSVRLIESQFHF